MPSFNNDRLVRLLGLSCLQYLTATESVHLTDAQFPPDGHTLTPEQNATLGTLHTILPFESKGTDDRVNRRFDVASRLGRYLPEHGRSLAIVLRRRAGGEVDDLEPSQDPVHQAVLSLIRDAYPLLLLPETSFHTRTEISSALFQHPAQREFEGAVLADNELNRLFPKESPESGWHGTYIGPRTGGSLQLSLFSRQVIVVAYEWARLDTLAPTLWEVANKARVVVDLVRKVVRGEAVSVPVRIALTGVRLSEAARSFNLHHVGPVHVRGRENRDNWLADRTETQGRIRTIDTKGEAVELDQSGDVIVETTMDYRIRLQDIDGLDEWPQELRTLSDAFEEIVDRIRLGLVLTPIAQGPAVVTVSWIASLDLLGQGISISWQEPQRSMTVRPHAMSVSDVDGWRKWSGLLLTQNTSNIDIALRRVLLAAEARQLPADILIDSVIAWENIFGASGESTLRVCGALAWLLRKDLDERKELVSELKSIYNLRSKVVHGQTASRRIDEKTSKRALDIACDAIRDILSNRTDLLDEGDSAQRSNRLLLGD